MITKCHSCFIVLTGYTEVTARRDPLPGDYTICANCGTIYQFGESMELLKLDADAVGQLACDNPKLYQALMVLVDSIEKQIKLN